MTLIFLKRRLTILKRLLIKRQAIMRSIVIRVIEENRELNKEEISHLQDKIETLKQQLQERKVSIGLNPKLGKDEIGSFMVGVEVIS